MKIETLNFNWKIVIQVKITFFEKNKFILSSHFFFYFLFFMTACVLLSFLACGLHFFFLWGHMFKYGQFAAKAIPNKCQPTLLFIYLLLKKLHEQHEPFEEYSSIFLRHCFFFPPRIIFFLYDPI